MPLIRREPTAAPTPTAPADLQQAAAALRRGSAQERRDAARSLSTHPAAAALLGDALADEGDRRVRQAIFTSLARMASAESADATIRHLRSDDADLRTGALDALREMMPVVRLRLPALLADPDPDIRVLCCDLARELPATEATELLCTVIERDTESNVCAAAIDVLAEIGTAAALPAIERCGSRFPNQSFLAFAIKIAAERIASSADR